jgi:radical SAM superfamily enzyme
VTKYKHHLYGVSTIHQVIERKLDQGTPYDGKIEIVEIRLNNLIEMFSHLIDLLPQETKDAIARDEGYTLIRRKK